MLLITGLRAERDLTRAKLGALAEIHPARVGQIENGRVVPYAVELARLARAPGWQSEAEGLLREVDK